METGTVKKFNETNYLILQEVLDYYVAKMFFVLLKQINNEHLLKINNINYYSSAGKNF